jgi:Ni,Fe-hydrogenase I large subunit
VTTKAYNPAVSYSNPDANVVKKMHEIMYGGPAYDPVADGASANGTGGGTYDMSNPHPESLMGFIGKPSNFWTWAGLGFHPSHLPLWAKVGVPLAGTSWANVTGNYLFDTVAAAHVFPEYFWFGSGYGRTLAWGIFEGADVSGYADQRLITRGRTTLGTLPNLGGGSHGAYPGFSTLPASHLDCREFTTYSAYNDPVGDSTGRHMWKGLTNALPINRDGSGVDGKGSHVYTYAKAPRYDSGGGNFQPYEVGPYARLMANAGALIGGGPATLAQITAVDAGQFGVYYPGMLADVDANLTTVGVMPGWGANLTNHLAWAQTVAPTSPVFYLPPGAIHTHAVTQGFGNDYYGDATLDRIACRALETYFVGMQIMDWFSQLTPGVSSNKTLFFQWAGSPNRKFPKNRASGAGLTEAPRGALGHWIKIGKGPLHKRFKKFRGKVNKYQIITPTTWNINPKDHNGVHGPAEFAMIGTPVVADSEPIEILRVLHSFDFCCACTVHVFNAKKEKKFEATLEALP